MKLGSAVVSSGLLQQGERLLLIGMAGVLTGFTNVSAVHVPLYRAEEHTSIITATASDSAGIKRITLTVTTGEMVNCTELGKAPTAIPCRQNASTITFNCDFDDSPTTATCTYQKNLADRSMVTYVAEAEPLSGSSRRSEEITYAGGNFPAVGVARPVWWHRDQAMASKIDIGFFPDNDYQGNYAKFTKDLETIARGAFFDENPVSESFAKHYTLYRPMVNLWAAPFGADAKPDCSRQFNALVDPIKGLVDGRVIVHKEGFSDCSAIALGGGGSVNASSARPDVNFVHESGHFLHGQADEYEGGGHSINGDCANIFKTKGECDAAALDHGIAEPNCVKILNSTWYHNKQFVNGHELYDIMEVLGDDASWQNDCRYCVVQRFLNCTSGSCY